MTVAVGHSKYQALFSLWQNPVRRVVHTDMSENDVSSYKVFISLTLTLIPE
jgi:hypothetical protein